MRWVLRWGLGAVLGVASSGGEQKTAVSACGSRAEFDALMRDVRVEPTKDGPGLTLVKRDLIADETGEAYYSKAFYNNVGMEVISSTTWVRKEFVLDDPETERAWLCLSGEPAGEGDLAFHITLNGHEFRYATTRQDPGIKYLYDSRRWLCGWLSIPVPKEHLKRGLNTFVIRGDGACRWRVGVELSLFPDRSAKSVDGGATWQRDALGVRSSLNGEYVIRLALDRYPSAGVVTSPPIDLTALAGEDTVGLPCVLEGVTVACTGEFPQGTGKKVQVRVGRTATYEPTTWTPWVPLARFDAKTAEARLGGQPHFRFLQYRIRLTTERPLVAPTLRKVTVAAAVRVAEPQSRTAAVEVVPFDNPRIVRASRRFVHMGVGPRQKILADRLAPVIAGAKSQYEMARRLMNYARTATPTSKNALRIGGPRDALTMMLLTRQGVSHVECEGRAEAMTQCCEAVGLNARPFGVGHIMTEVWLNEFGAWGVFDPSPGDLNYVNPKTMRPMSALDLLDALQAGRTTTLVRWRDGKETGRKTAKVWWAFDRFLISLRSNFNETDRPLHYMDTYSSRAHLVVLNDKLEPLTFTDMQSRRRGDFESTLNQARLHLIDRGQRRLGVQIESVTPNFREFVVTMDGKPLDVKPPGGAMNVVRHLDEVTGEFQWDVPAGVHEMTVHPVNAMGIPGIKTTVKVKVGT